MEQSTVRDEETSALAGIRAELNRSLRDAELQAQNQADMEASFRQGMAKMEAALQVLRDENAYLKERVAGPIAVPPPLGERAERRSTPTYYDEQRDAHNTPQGGGENERPRSEGLASSTHKAERSSGESYGRRGQRGRQESHSPRRRSHQETYTASHAESGRARAPSRPRNPAEAQAIEGIRRLNSSPFTLAVLNAHISRRFNAPKFKQYDGQGDPLDHLGYYKQTMALHSRDDPLMCRVFPSSLAPTAMAWFYHLEPASIDSFEVLSTTFVTHYITSCKAKKDVDALFDIARGNDSLRLYVTRFKSEMLLINNCNPHTAMVAFRKGLCHGDELRLSLAGRPPQDLIEMFTRAEKFCKKEDEKLRCSTAGQSAEKVQRVEEKTLSRAPFKKQKREEVNETKAGLPLNIPLLQLYHKIKNEPFLEKAPATRGDPSLRDQTKHCLYHDAKGHLTEDCYTLRRQVRALISRGFLREYLAKDGEQQASVEQPTGKIIIHTIHGGCIASYPSNAALKRMVRTAIHKREINAVSSCAEKSVASTNRHNSLEFTDDDLIPVSLPHNDALVITTLIANCEVRRCLIDTGSTTELLFRHAFEQMNVSQSELISSTCPLVGFNGHVSYAMGKIRLMITLGTVSVPVDFMIVDTDSPYNVILGRNWIHKMRAVPSTYHQLIKFPTPNGVMQVRSDQVAAIQCNSIALKNAKEASPPIREESPEEANKKAKVSDTTDTNPIA